MIHECYVGSIAVRAFLPGFPGGASGMVSSI